MPKTAQITSYAGFDVIENQSGNRKGKTKISKKGNGHIRRALHFPALNIVPYEQGNFHLLYQRIYSKSNIKMKAYVAVQRKLLTLIHTLWKKMKPLTISMKRTFPEMKSWCLLWLRLCKGRFSKAEILPKKQPQVNLRRHKISFRQRVAVSLL